MPWSPKSNALSKSVKARPVSSDKPRTATSAASGVKPIPPIVTSTPLRQVTDEQLRRYAELIYRRTGIKISPQKKTLLSNRLSRRLRETGIAGFEEYYRHLTSLPNNHPEWDAFLQEITTHETFLFRDEGQWRWFRQQFLPSLAASQPQVIKQLRIWSAACSTGDEAFTAALSVAASFPDLSQWQIQILGTDIGIGAVQQARTATFGERAMRLVPEEFKSRFFDKLPNADVWRAKLKLTAMTTFRQHNLMEPLRERPFHLIFLKNVLIYFDPPSKRVVLDHVKRLMLPNGYLVVGAAEGVAELLSDMKRLQPWLYQKPVEAAAVEKQKPLLAVTTQ